MESYGMTAEEFPQIKFSNKKKGKENNCLDVNKEIIKDAETYYPNMENLLMHWTFILCLSTS